MLTRCPDCKNHKYCPEYIKMMATGKEEDAIAGCIGGEPRFKPNMIAEKYFYEIYNVAQKCGLDVNEYLDDIVDEVKKKINQENKIK